MAYVVPQVLVYQEFNEIPSEITDPLRAHISGGHAQLIRYAEADEKSLGALGDYDPTIDVAYNWPNRAAGAIVDQDYASLYIDNALLLYFSDLIGADSTIAPVAGSTNQIAADGGLYFKSAPGYARHADLYDRDVAVGDTVYLRGIVASEAIELWTYVRGFAAASVAAVTASATLDGDNAAGQVATISGVQTGGVTNCLDVTFDATAYNGLIDGNINEVYTLTVTKSSAGGDLTTAEVRLVSASGEDDEDGITPAAESATTAVGSRGLLVGWEISGTGASCSSGSPDTANDLIVGQQWQITVAQQFDQPLATSGGTYTGTADTTYIVEVTRGGLFAATEATEQPQITVTTAHGTDISGPTTVTDANVAVALGTKGVTILFHGAGGDADPVDGLRKGDRYYIGVTAAGDGGYTTLILGHALGDLVDATDLDLKLYIKKDIEVPKNRIGFAPLVNYSLSSTQITVKSGIVAYDATFTDDGDPVAMDVVGGSLFVEYRAWLQTLIDEINSITDIGDLDDIAGSLHPDNPLKWGVYCALLNSNGTAVRYTAVSDPDDVDTWTDVLNTLIGAEGIYNLVPLTKNATVLSAFAAHVDSQSSAEAGRWRGLFVNLSTTAATAIVDSSTNNGTEVLATVADDPNSSGTQYTLVTADDGDFVANGVAAGDIVRAEYTSDGFGGVTYSEYVVDSVINENTLLLAAGPSHAISVAAKVEIWHNNTKDELSQQIMDGGAAYGSNRVCAIWPDTIEQGDYTVQGYHLCAALAGLRSGVVPHQGLTHIEIAGFDSVPRTDYFNGSQLNAMAGSGVWIVMQTDDGTIYSRHAVTTGDYSDLNAREESVRTNVDAMSYLFLARLATYIGKSNVTPDLLAILRVELESSIDYLKTNGYTASLGSQLIDGEITELRQHTLLLDRVVAVLDLTIGYPLNNLEVHLVI